MYKECPMCGALVFEDMDQCFECLHVFGEEVPEIEEISCSVADQPVEYESAMAAVLSAAEEMRCSEMGETKAESVEGAQELLAGKIQIVKENAPEGALEIRIRLNGPLLDYFKASPSASSACS